MLYKLGKKRPCYDKRTMLFSKFIDLSSLPYIPSTSHWPNAAPLGMLMNDSLGDCAIAAPLHMEKLWSKANGQNYTPTDNDALIGYEAVGGYNPSDPSTDQGCILLDVLKYWRTKGFGGRKIGAFVQVNQLNHRHVQAASYLFGGLLIGLALPVSAQSQTDSGNQTWALTPAGLTGPGMPGSWGGHAVCIPGYNQRTLDTVTWGERISQTWGFWDAYVDECYAMISTDFIENPLKAPNGFDMASLTQWLNQITG